VFEHTARDERKRERRGEAGVDHGGATMIGMARDTSGVAVAA
jgi:hypothetical protein